MICPIMTAGRLAAGADSYEGAIIFCDKRCSLAIELLNGDSNEIIGRKCSLTGAVEHTNHISQMINVDPASTEEDSIW